MQCWTKYLDRCKDEVNWTGLENFDICFVNFLTFITKVLLLKGILGIGLYLHPIAILLIFFFLNS